MKKNKEQDNKEIKNSDNNEQINENMDAVIEELEQKNTILQRELEDSKDRLLRKAAEFENYKRRTENDQMNLLKYAAESFIIKLLPVMDDFERSMQHIDTAKDVEAVKKGINMVYDKFRKLLEEQGVIKIAAVGKPFDVNYHEAIMQKNVEDAKPHTVLDEIESGYTYKERVIRHSKVIVSDDESGKSLRNAE